MTDFSNVFLISDMDGTLINSKSQISTINKYALNEFTKAGGTFAVATGRTLHSCKQYIPELPINAPSIFYNGTILQDTNNNVVLKTLSLQTKILFNFLKQCLIHCPNTCIELHTKDTFYIITKEEFDDPVIKRENLSYIRSNLDDLYDLDILKVQFYTTNTHTKSVRPKSHVLAVKAVLSRAFKASSPQLLVGYCFTASSAPICFFTRAREVANLLL